MTVLALAKAGDNIVSTRSLYCGTFHQFEVLLPNLGVQARFLPDDYTSEDIHSLVDPKTKLVFSESIGNPRLDVPDYELLIAEAHRAGVPVVVGEELLRINSVSLIVFQVDATFTAGGFFCRPFDHGVDIVVHSATKWIGGHGTTLGGVVIDSGNFDWDRNAFRFPQLHAIEDGQPGTSLWSRFGPEAFALYLRFNQLRDYGSTLSAQAAQQLLIGMETLSLRCERQAFNALEVAKWLRQHPKIEWVSHLGFKSHPTHERAKRYNRNGLSSVFTFGIKGGALAALRFIDGLRLIINAAK
jgi:O-acetylhomoserine/O-acetylserine sulfhydrylase